MPFITIAYHCNVFEDFQINVTFQQTNAPAQSGVPWRWTLRWAFRTISFIHAFIIHLVVFCLLFRTSFMCIHGNFGCVLFVSACLPILLTLTLASLFDAAMGISDNFFHSAAFILVVFSFFIWLCCVLFRPVFCQYSTHSITPFAQKGFSVNVNCFTNASPW